jgi:hypothetical protein
MTKRVITKCYLCKKDKEHNASGYCKPCGTKYYRERRDKINKKEYSYDDIQRFREHIIHNHYLIDLNELNTIISIYCDIVTNINEYDNLSSGKQIMKMWDKIMNYKEIIKEPKVKIIKEKKVRKNNYSAKQREWILANRDRVNQRRREYYLATGK